MHNEIAATPLGRCWVWLMFLGFRFAPPQATCLRPVPGRVPSRDVVFLLAPPQATCLRPVLGRVPCWLVVVFKEETHSSV